MKICKYNKMILVSHEYNLNIFKMLIYLKFTYIKILYLNSYLKFYLDWTQTFNTFIKSTNRCILIHKSRAPRRRGIISIERDDFWASFRSGKAIRAPTFNPGAFVTRVTHFPAPHVPAIPSRNVQDPRRLPSFLAMPLLLFFLLLVIPPLCHLSLFTWVTERGEET